MADDSMGRGDGQGPDRAADPSPDGLSDAPVVTLREQGEPGFGVITLQARGADLIESEAIIGRAGFNNHSASIISIAPFLQQHARVVSAAWIESAMGDVSGVGRVMWQSFDPSIAANDNPIWATNHDGTGAIGCEPLISGLAGGATLLTWVGADGHAHGKLYPSDGDTSGGGDAYAAVNASLADMGPTAPAPDGSRRLQVIEQRPGNLAIMWLALADSGYVVRGSIISAPQDKSTDSDAAEVAGATIDVRLPSSFTGQFSLQRAGDGSGDVVVSYAAGSQLGTAVVALRAADDAKEGPTFALLDAANMAAAVEAKHSATSPSTGPHEIRADGSVDGAIVEAAHPSDAAAPASLAISLGSVRASDPIVASLNGQGFAVVWEEPGASEKAVSIKLALFDGDGTARTLPDGSTAITVTDNALATVAPSITNLGSGAAVTYVDAGAGALIIEAFDSLGGQIGQELVIDDGANGAISEIAMASSHVEGDAAGGEIAVVYVRDDQDDQVDYGSIMLQRLRALDADADGTSDELVAVGGDGQADGTDGPATLTTMETAADGTSATQDVHGRAPAVTELDQGEFAVVWIEHDGAREIIKGCVLEADGSQVLRIDLTALLQDGGILKGTKPVLIANGEGDILVGWLQRDGTDGKYAVMAAVYDAIGVGQWAVPDEPMQLQTFDREPKDFYVAWAGGDAAAIDVTWRADSSGSGSGGIFTQRFDLEGNGLGRAEKVHSGGDINGGDPTTAGLVEGQIVVVYAEQSRSGDLDLAAQVIDAETGDTSTIEIDPDTPGASAYLNANVYEAPASELSTGFDQEIAVNVVATAPGATVSHVNGEPITAAEPVDIGTAWVQLREDGWLTISPDAGYAGDIAFDYTLAGGASGASITSRLTVNVASGEPVENVETGIRLADLDISDSDVSTEGLTAAGLDPDMFAIVGGTLYLKAGLEFEFDTTPSLTVEVRASGVEKPDAAVNFTLEVAETSGQAGMEAYLAADTFVFASGFNEGLAADDDAREVIDMSSSPYSTFQELIESGALVQTGQDVVITLDPTDPYHSDKITLRGIELSSLTSADFRF